MKLILISGSEKSRTENDIITKMFADRSKEEPSIVTQMFENGLETFHLRKPKFSLKEMIEYLDKIPVRFHSKIVLHSHHLLTVKYNTKGVSLSKYDKNNSFKKWLKLKWLKFKNPTLTVSTSHNRISSLFEEKFKYDYVFLSPIFDNLTGGFISGAQQNTLKSVIDRIPFKVIARGGVSAEKVQLIKEMGFAGLAIHSTIWKKQDPFAEFIRFKEKFQELGIPIE